jgi:2,5-diamino-6-(ribosylamino)-4(3H)-pyrimidinone 5'-phosphate reductase
VPSDDKTEVDRLTDTGEIYAALNFGEPRADRPYTFINMVTTIDGKTITGHRGEDVLDLGSKADHLLMRRIEDQADSVLVGATTLRAADERWNPKTDFRVVVSNRGGFNYDRPYFQGGGKSYVACSEDAAVQPEKRVERLVAGKGRVDVAILLAKLKEMGAKRLLCFGGSELNAQLLERDLIDELFLTIAPKVKLGRDVPTYAGGEPLPRDKMLRFQLVETHSIADEVFLRYRRKQPTNVGSA